MDDRLLGVVDVEKESSEEPAWPPVWKPLEESVQYRCGMITPFLDKWEFEELEHMDDSEFDEDDSNFENIHTNLKNFLKQIRETRGYDVDWVPPGFMCSPFDPIHVESLLENEFLYEILMAQVNFVVGKINEEAEMHGERYELLKVEKLVLATLHRLSLITFSVKQVAPNAGVIETVQAMVFTANHRTYELDEWRFKPEPSYPESSD